MNHKDLYYKKIDTIKSKSLKMMDDIKHPYSCPLYLINIRGKVLDKKYNNLREFFDILYLNTVSQDSVFYANFLSQSKDIEKKILTTVKLYVSLDKRLKKYSVKL